MRFRPLLAAGSTATVAALAGVAAARAARIDERLSPLIALETLTPWLFLPAWGALAVGLAQRRRGLAGTAALLALCHAGWVWSDLPFWKAEQPAARGSGLTLVTVNAYKENSRAAELGRELSGLRPDVLAVQELSPRVHRGLAASGLLSEFPYRFEMVAEGSFGAAIYSRFPIRERSTVKAAGHRMPRVTVDADGTLVDVIAVHAVQPMTVPGRLVRQLDDLGRIAERTSRPLILAGDFNATRQYRPFRRLLDGPPRDAHLDHGRGLAVTWPAIGPGPPFSLIDHVLVSGEIAVRSVSERTVAGSDHRAVVARLQLPRAEAGAVLEVSSPRRVLAG